MLMQRRKHPTSDVIKPVLRVPCPESASLFMVAIIAACLRPLGAQVLLSQFPQDVSALKTWPMSTF